MCLFYFVLLHAKLQRCLSVAMATKKRTTVAIKSKCVASHTTLHINTSVRKRALHTLQSTAHCILHIEAAFGCLLACFWGRIALHKHSRLSWSFSICIKIHMATSGCCNAVSVYVIHVHCTITLVTYIEEIKFAEFHAYMYAEQTSFLMRWKKHINKN